ncbi:MAG: 50S ribosomal protein L11 methyltransferase [Anaerolineaceae bacterium]
MAEPRWLEVSLSVDGELAEAVADVLSRYIEGGVVVESNVEYDETEEIATPVDPVRVYGYLPVSDHLEEDRQHLEEALWHLGQIQPLPPLNYKPIQEQNWMEAWKKNFHPIPVGERMLILPAWVKMTDPNRIAVKIDPSMAFGTGTHPTTQLCMELLEKYVRPGTNLIDVGCGTGILSIAALKLGVRHALGVDIDPLSVSATRENAEANEVLANLEVGEGSVAEVRAGNFSIRSAPVVLTNILAPIILRLFEAGLADLVEPGGTLVLSGILEPQRDDVLAAAAKRGLHAVEQRQMGDWVAMALERKVD